MSSASTPTDPKRIFVTDCEGPISKNDNAFELASRFIPRGDYFFTMISRYDDILADIVKRQGYKAGDTLKLILPFLKAYDVTNQLMIEYSSQSILLVPAARETLHFVRGFMPTFIVSTSYEQYTQALCRVVDFPFENVYSTRLDLNNYKISADEETKLKRLREDIVKLPMLEIPQGAQSLNDLPTEQQQTFETLDETFWNKISSMNIGRVLKEVDPIGGVEKALAVKEIVAKLDSSLKDIMYVGDSITDVEVLRLIRNAGGLSVSFNGNNYAVRESEIAVLSEHAIVTAVLANAFNESGKVHVMNLIKDWTPSSIQRITLNEPLKRHFLELCRKKFPRVIRVTSNNVKKLMQESTAYRKTVRGKAIGKLG